MSAKIRGFSSFTKKGKFLHRLKKTPNDLFFSYNPTQVFGHFLERNQVKRLKNGLQTNLTGELESLLMP